MRGFERVLAPIDFSEGSHRIVDTALRVLGPEGTLTVLHVVEWLPAVTQATLGIYPHRQDVDKIKELSTEKLAAIVRQHPGRRIEPLVKEGRPAVAILDAIAEVEPDLVVMGTHGRSGLEHLLIGSVAERVVRKARCSVLLVRD